MKIGCAVGCFTFPHYNPPYEEAIIKIGKLGFEGLELIAYLPGDLETYYTKERNRNLKDLYESYGMELSEFILYASLVEGLASRDKKEKEKAYDVFKRGIEVALELGTNIINIVSNWPNELIAPIAYPPAYFYPYVPGIDRFEPKHKMVLPPNFDANGLWESYIESLTHVTNLAEEAGVYLALEGHANVIVGTTDAMLRAFDRIDNQHFGTNFDVAWQFLQREYIPWSIYKLRGRIFHVHARDGDGLVCYALPPGMGVIDWHVVIRALKEIGYTGFISLELGGLSQPERYVREAKTYLVRVMEEEGVR
ncbi:AP endonuclease, family 2 [[Clostridium] ultunense Esp]|nr:AP endonuclease, family 2 [[Clostridium] ultunense Esp]